MSIGVPYETFWKLTFDGLWAFEEAYRLKRKVSDEENWINGQYTLSATTFAVEHCLSGQKARSEYIKEPIMKRALMTNEEKELEKQREVNLFFKEQDAMRMNFRAHKRMKEIEEKRKAQMSGMS